MVDHQVLLLDGQERVAAIVADPLGEARRIGREFQIGARQADDFRQVLQRQHAVERDDLVGFDIEFLGDEGAHFRGHVRVRLQPDHRAAPAAFQRRLEQADQVFRLFLDFEIAVADDAEQALRLDRKAGKQLLDMGDDHRLQQHQPRAASGRLRQADEAVDLGRHAHQRLHPRARAAVREVERERQAEIGNEGEGMSRVDRQRRQHREDMQEEMVVEPEPFGLAELRRLDEDDVLRLEFVLEMAPAAQLLQRQFADPGADQRQLLGRGQPVLGRRLDPGAQLPAQAGDAHHEEFVEIIGGNGNEAHPLQQGMRFVRRLQQDAAVELQPGEFAIDETLGRAAQRLAGEGLLVVNRPGCCVHGDGLAFLGHVVLATVFSLAACFTKFL